MSRPGRSARLATLAVAAMAVLAACGTSGPSAAPATPLPSGVIPVEAKEYAFTPATVAAAAGTVTFSVRNNGVQEHQFEIYSGQTRVDGIDSIGAGTTKGLSVALAAGQYTLICKLNGHDQIGMKAALTVN